VISGGGITASVDLLPNGATPPESTWATYAVPFTAATFAVTPQEWSTLLANVTELRLSVEALFGNEVEGIDNFQITPEPALGLLLALGLAAARLRRQHG
jgi:hypothetical protein